MVALPGAPYRLWMVPYLGPIGHASEEVAIYPNPRQGNYLCVYIKNTYQDQKRLADILERHGAIAPEEYTRQLGPSHATFK